MSDFEEPVRFLLISSLLQACVFSTLIFFGMIGENESVKNYFSILHTETGQTSRVGREAQATHPEYERGCAPLPGAPRPYQHPEYERRRPRGSDHPAPPHSPLHHHPDALLGGDGSPMGPLCHLPEVEVLQLAPCRLQLGLAACSGKAGCQDEDAGDGLAAAAAGAAAATAVAAGAAAVGAVVAAAVAAGAGTAVVVAAGAAAAVCCLASSSSSRCQVPLAASAKSACSARRRRCQFRWCTWCLPAPPKL